APVVKTESVHSQWTEEQAAACLQGLYRNRQARRQLDARLAQVYRKVRDVDSGRFYYVNLTTQAVSWEPPALLLKSSIDVDEFQRSAPVLQ
ncbi:Crinkler, partial [Globisporangium polare]